MKDSWCRAWRKLAHIRGDVLAVDYWTNRLRTNRVGPILRSRFDERVVPHVQVESTTDCNYSCSFCPQSSCKRPSQYITSAGFDHLLDELKRLDFSSVFNYGVNTEPFMHPNLMSFCEKVSESLPKAVSYLVTNGSLIRHDHLDFLDALAHPPILAVDDYTANRSVTRNVEEWRARHPQARLRFEMRLRKADEVLGNRAGNQPGAFKNIRLFHNILCTWPFYCMFFTADLRAFLCCSDYQHRVILGDLKKQDLMSIWTGVLYREIRAKMLDSQRRHIPLCSRCNDVRHSLPEHCGGAPWSGV